MGYDYGTEEKCVERVEGIAEGNRQLGRSRRKWQLNI
jgi:hypothetical protein